ncbi:hypothetical protein [Paenarthrobacter sp. AMU7]|uniref:Uncharacterized protein n=1 Tax=Paenarthrobacter sp. AMU7 TaxID=3162492 RepID=A0AB39YP68_9MICC
MQEADDTQIAALNADARALEISLLARARTWAKDQGVFARTFLLQEARLTVVGQADVTETIMEEVTALKKEILAIGDDVAIMFDRWSETADLEDAKALAQDPRKTYLALTQQAHADFAKAFIERGYNPGIGASSYQGTASSNWFFYIPETGTARNPTMKYDQGSHEGITELWHSWRETAHKIETTKEQIQRNRAASLWDLE